MNHSLHVIEDKDEENELNLNNQILLEKEMQNYNCDLLLQDDDLLSPTLVKKESNFASCPNCLKL